ncbi:MAG TPA: winged helix-turn-helix domain-containing protein [Pyrinomonadaceae bacterium]
MVEKTDVTYVFGEFSLDLAERKFARNGERVHVPAKEFDTLLYFVQNPGRMLSKDEMMSAIWDETFVEEGNLAQYVSRLRKLIDTNGHNYIKTLPKRGYRFDADVQTVGDVPDLERRRTLWPWAAGGTAALIALAAVAWYFAIRPKPAAESIPDTTYYEPVALTDGKQDDGAVQWTSDNHIRFFRHVSPNRVESWTMNLDGSDQHRETAPVKDFLNGMWSPDGKKVFFMKEGDSKTTYLANSDGSDEITLPMLVGNSDWAPDSSKFVYETKVAEGNTEIYLYDLATRQNTNLTRNTVFDADPSFSPDSQHIVYLSGRDGNADIYMMDLTGRIERRLTDHPAFDNFPSVSPDGTQMLFFSNRDGGDKHMFIRDLNDDLPPVRVSDFPGMQGTHAKCWSADGTQLVFTSDVGGKDTVYRMNIEPYRPRKLIADDQADLQSPRVSPDGTKLLTQARLSDHRVELRLADLSSGARKTIFTTSPGLPVTFLLFAAWSPDGSQIVFDNRTADNSQIFTVNADGGDLRQLTDGQQPDYSPEFSRDGRQIYFTRDFYGKPKIYVMDSDGGNARQLTNKSGYELGPAISPDGKTLLFSADRLDGRKMGLDIYAIELSQPDVEHFVISRPMHEASVVYSPDGGRIAFVARSDDNAEIYVANADGSGLLRITRNKANDGSPTFSADGKTLIFSSDRDGKFAIYQVDIP